MKGQYEAVLGVIRERRTLKAVATGETLHCEPHTCRSEWDELLGAAIWAPFHRPSHEMHRSGEGRRPSLVPWRFHVLDAEACRTLRLEIMHRWGAAAKAIPQMLGVADVLVQATWLPNPPSRPLAGNEAFEPTIENMEHIAAAAAAIQNLLLLATARAIPTYWSSGGVLRETRVFEMLRIPQGEVLLGSVFLFASDVESRPGVETKAGAHREKRGDLSEWLRWVEPAVA